MNSLLPLPKKENWETPSDYGMEFIDRFRPGQLDAIRKIESKSAGSTTLLSAPTGSGKSIIARAVGARHSITAVVKTKALQQEIYGKLDFDVLYGRSNYPCIHPDRLSPDDSADQCLYFSKMDDCEYALECPYLIKKRIAQQSSIRVINASYLMTARWPRDSKYATDYIFYDECHMLPDETLEFVGCTVRDVERIRWRLPEFPACYDSSRENVMKCLKWMEQAIGIIDITISGMKADDGASKAQKSRGERLMMKLEQTCSGIHRSGDDWYVRAGARALEYMGKTMAGIVIKPLTARHHFPPLFLSTYPRAVLMSATIGNVVDFADELGIERYDFEKVPNQWPPESRPVHVLDCPPMGHTAGEPARVKQAEVIAKALNELPQDWSGIIHVTSWKQANELTQRLSRYMQNPHRLHVPQRGTGTHGQMDEWNGVKARSKGMLVVTPSMSEGVDLLEERICIVAKTPFPYTAPGSYEDERRIYSNRFYRWLTASRLEQMCGRTRRGRPQDYDDSFNVRGYVAIADGSFRKMGMQKSCSTDFVDALTFE